MGSATAVEAGPRTRSGHGAVVQQPIAHAFDTTAAYSLGAEEEFVLVDPGTGELVPHAEQVLASCGTPAVGAVGSEVVASVVESASPVCATATELEIELHALRARLASAAASVGCRLVSVGTHPFSTAEQPISAGDRYAGLARDYPWVVQEAATYGLHVHVGVQGADRAVAVCNALRGWLPHLLALSANSPLWRGERTGLQSTRLPLAQLFPRSGVPPIFAGYDDYVRVVRMLETSPQVDDYTHAWWLVRPHPQHGTVEVRVCDAQTDVRRSTALAALVQALVRWIDQELELLGGALDWVPAVVCEENLWSAARYGCDGTFVDEHRGHAVPTRDALHELLHAVGPSLDALDSLRHVPVLEEMIARTGAQEQLAELARLGEDAPALVRHLAVATH